MESVVTVPELPDIKAEIKAEDFCSVASSTPPTVPVAAPVTPNPGGDPSSGASDSIACSAASMTAAAAPPPLANHQIDQHHLTHPDPTCNWVGNSKDPLKKMNCLKL